MSWDIALDSGSGDVIFGPTRDLLGTTGDGLTKQRILLRCKIPRGSWMYDSDRTLGSQLYTISSIPSARQVAQAPAMVREALEPMDDIQITDVQASTDENNRVLVSVNFVNLVSEEETSSLSEDPSQVSGNETTFTV